MYKVIGVENYDGQVIGSDVVGYAPTKEDADKLVAEEKEFDKSLALTGIEYYIEEV